MKEKVSLQISQLSKALSHLNDALKLPANEINRDATIQRFEFTFELSWKIMQSVAKEQGLEAFSPRDSIRTAAQLGLIDSVDIWFDFLEARNLSSHLYNETMAEEVYEKIRKFPPQVEELTKQAQQAINQ